MGKQSYSWGDIPDPSKPGSGSGKASDLYMKLEPGNKYRVRLYGDPTIRFFAWYNGSKYNVPEDLLDDFERHTGEKPRLYICACVIDRNDTANGKTRFKLLEKGTTIFAPMKTYSELTGTNPGGDVGPDFFIKAVPGKERRNTKYEVMAVPNSEAPFSEKEKELINRQDKLDSEELKKLPIGERGPLDLEAFYDMEKGRKKVMDLLDGNLQEGEDVDELTGEVEHEDEAEDSSESEEQKPVTANASSGKEENLDDLIDQFE